MTGQPVPQGPPHVFPPAPVDPAACLAALSRGGIVLSEADHWAEGVDRLLAEIGRVSGGSRVWIFQVLELQADAVVQDHVFEWAASEHYRQLRQRRFRFFTSSLEDAVYRQLIEERQAGKPQDIQVAAMPPCPLKANLESQAIQSMATAPICVNGQWWGTLGIDDCERPVSWKGAGLHLLEAAGQLIAAALYRYHLNHRSRQIELFHKVAGCGVWEINLRNGRVWCSQALKTALGYPVTYPRVPLRRLLARVHPEDRVILWSKLRTVLSDQAFQFRLDVRLRIQREEWIWQEIIAEIQRSDRGRPYAIAGLILDISRRKQSEEQALAASQLDVLTGALNRRGMDRHLSAADQVGAIRHFILLDIDHFKAINDTHGHPVGDALLRLMVLRIRHELRPDDRLVRLGGEEFAIIVTGLEDSQALALAERIRRRVFETPFHVEVPDGKTAVTVTMSISLGLARQAGDHPDPLNRVMAQADKALYAAKHAGRNRTVPYASTAA